MDLFECIPEEYGKMGQCAMYVEETAAAEPLSDLVGHGNKENTVVPPSEQG